MTNSSQPDASAVAELVKQLRFLSGVLHTSHRATLDSAATLLEQQSARLQELERDAARYRWLRNRTGLGDAGVWEERDGEPVECGWLCLEQLDRIIDAALAADAAGEKHD